MSLVRSRRSAHINRTHGVKYSYKSMRKWTSFARLSKNNGYIGTTSLGSDRISLLGCKEEFMPEPEWYHIVFILLSDLRLPKRIGPRDLKNFINDVDLQRRQGSWRKLSSQGKLDILMTGYDKPPILEKAFFILGSLESPIGKRIHVLCKPVGVKICLRSPYGSFSEPFTVLAAVTKKGKINCFRKVCTIESTLGLQI